MKNVVMFLLRFRLFISFQSIKNIYLFLLFAGMGYNQNLLHVRKSSFFTPSLIDNFPCSAGGLVTAVAPVVIECDGVWVGWTGISDFSENDTIPESKPDDSSPTAGKRNSWVRLREV